DDLRNRIARSGVAQDRVLGRKETHIFNFFNYTDRPIEADLSLGYTKVWRSSAGRFGLLRLTSFGDEIGDEARLGKCSDVNLGRPILCLEAARLGIALRDRLHPPPP